MNTNQGDGYVKYRVIHSHTENIQHPRLAELDAARTQLFDLGLIGVYPDGIGFGNVSVRDAQGFVISGSATGAKRQLGTSGYCRVASVDIPNNTVVTVGPVAASSEAMTHAAIYQARADITCVLHIHSRPLWQRLIAVGHPATAASAPYGSPEMAQAMLELVRAINQTASLLVMAGHVEGLIAYGPNIPAALNQILQILE